MQPVLISRNHLAAIRNREDMRLAQAAMDIRLVVIQAVAKPRRADQWHSTITFDRGRDHASAGELDATDRASVVRTNLLTKQRIVAHIGCVVAPVVHAALRFAVAMKRVR